MTNRGLKAGNEQSSTCGISAAGTRAVNGKETVWFEYQDPEGTLVFHHGYACCTGTWKITEDGCSISMSVHRQMRLSPRRF